MKTFTKPFAVLAAVATVAMALTSCEPFGSGEDEETTTGSVETTIPGMEGERCGANLLIQNNGEAGIEGLYSTDFQFNIPSTESDDILFVALTAFHNSPAFTPGTYTIPSTGASTVRGNFYSMSGNIPGGSLFSGSVSVAVAGDNYTVTFNTVTARINVTDEAGVITGHRTEQASFVYNGTAEFADISGQGTLYNPQYGSSTTIMETTTGTKPKYMGMSIGDPSLNNGLYIYTLNFTSDTGELDIYIALRCETGGGLKPGTYTAGDSVAGTFEGFFDCGEEMQRVHLFEGRITISESGGVYTVTLQGVAGDEWIGGNNTVRRELNGTYIGGKRQ